MKMDNQLSAVIALLIVVLVFIILCGCASMCLMRKIIFALKQLDRYDTFQRQLLQPPIRQSTTMDLNYYSENENINIGPISNRQETIYTEENETQNKRFSSNKNVYFKESSKFISDDEAHNNNVPYYIDQTTTESTSSDSEDFPSNYNSNCRFKNVNANRQVSALKPLVDLMNNKRLGGRPYLETCIEEDTDSDALEAPEVCSKFTYNSSSTYEANGNGQANKRMQQAKVKVRSDSRCEGKEHSSGRNTSLQGVVRSKKRAMQRSKSWDPNNKEFNLK